MTAKGSSVCALMKGEQLIGIYSTLKGLCEQYGEKNTEFPSYATISRKSAKARKVGKLAVKDFEGVDYMILFMEVK